MKQKAISDQHFSRLPKYEASSAGLLNYNCIWIVTVLYSL